MCFSLCVIGYGVFGIWGIVNQVKVNLCGKLEEGWGGEGAFVGEEIFLLPRHACVELKCCGWLLKETSSLKLSTAKYIYNFFKSVSTYKIFKKFFARGIRVYNM